MGLVIERLIGESFVIGDNITVTLTEIRGATVDAKPGRLIAKLLIQAPRDSAVGTGRARPEGAWRMNDPVETIPARIIQIQAVPISAGANCGDHVELWALCDDGSLWMSFRSNGYANVPTHGMWYNVERGRQT